MDAEMQQAQQMATQQQLLGQAGQLAGAPIMDPSKNPEGVANLGEQLGLGEATEGLGETTPPEE